MQLIWMGLDVLNISFNRFVCFNDALLMLQQKHDTGYNIKYYAVTEFNHCKVKYVDKRSGQYKILVELGSG